MIGTRNTVALVVLFGVATLALSRLVGSPTDEGSTGGARVDDAGADRSAETGGQH